MWGKDGGKAAFDMVLKNHAIRVSSAIRATAGTATSRPWRLVGVPPLPCAGDSTTASRRTADGTRQS